MAGVNQMTEFQFIENMAFYQRRFEKLHFKLICEMNYYIRSNPVHNRYWLHKIQLYTDYITLTSEWITILKNFNSGLTGAPDKVRPPTDAITSPQGRGIYHAIK